MKGWLWRRRREGGLTPACVLLMQARMRRKALTCALASSARKTDNGEQLSTRVRSWRKDDSRVLLPHGHTRRTMCTIWGGGEGEGEECEEKAAERELAWSQTLWWN